MRGLRAAIALALVIAIAVSLAPAMGAKKLKPPKEGHYVGDSGGVQASVWVDIKKLKPLKAVVVQERQSLESGDPFTHFTVPAACGDGTHQPFSLGISAKELKISNKTGGFRDEITNAEEVGTGTTTSGTIDTHTLIVGKINGKRASGTVEFTKTNHTTGPNADIYGPSCTTNGPVPWQASLP